METLLIILSILLVAWLVVSVLSRVASELRNELHELAQSMEANWKKQQSAENMATARNEAINDAIIEALSRVDSCEELGWLNVHYDAIKELRCLRASGVPEERIVKDFMSYNQGRNRGYKVPSNNPKSGKREILRYSPYYIATNKVQIGELRRLQDEAASTQDPLTTLFGWDPDQEPADTEERELPVIYKNEDGDIVEYPSGKITKSEY
jgi:hypothetical protein